MALVLSLWWPAFLALCRWAIFRLRIPLILAAPIIWVGLEYFRAYFFTGFPWYYLGHSQSRFLYVIQIADMTGALGVSLVIAIVNAFIVDVLTLPLFHHTKRGSRLTARRKFASAWSRSCWGQPCVMERSGSRTPSSATGPGSPCFNPTSNSHTRWSGDPFEILGTFERLVERALSVKDRPDLIVWPETAYPFGFITIELGRRCQESGKPGRLDTRNEEAPGVGLARSSKKT